MNNIENLLYKSKILCVTTFNKTLYDNYAHKFIETYNFPYDLMVYCEDDTTFLENIKVSYNLILVNSTKNIPEMNEFIKCNKERNITDVKNGGFLKDGIRFCYKVFVVTHAGLNFPDYNYIMWLDADNIFFNPLPYNIISSDYTNDNSMMSFLGRKTMYSECGFLIFNMKHPYIKPYFLEMKRMYTSNDIYKLKEWHDSYVWDYVRRDFENKYKIKTFSITGFDRDGDILAQSSLIKYLRHLKGNRKYIFNEINKKNHLESLPVNNIKIIKCNSLTLLKKK